MRRAKLWFGVVAQWLMEAQRAKHRVLEGVVCVGRSQSPLQEGENLAAVAAIDVLEGERAAHDSEAENVEWARDVRLRGCALPSSDTSNGWSSPGWMPSHAPVRSPTP